MSLPWGRALDTGLASGRREAFLGICRTIAHLARRRPEAFAACTAAARGLRDSLPPILCAMDALSGATCPRCPDPCCDRATIWFDLGDLVFLSLNRIPLPPGQPREEPGGPCRYRSLRGCTLPRGRRPWTCTAYLCPVQKARLASEDPAPSLADALASFRRGRRAMAAEWRQRAHLLLRLDSPAPGLILWPDETPRR